MISWIKRLIRQPSLDRATGNIQQVPAQTPQGPMRKRRLGDWIVRLDLSSQVLGMDVLEERTFREGQSRLFPTLKDISNKECASVSALAQKAKQFDDGLMAAVELAAQIGIAERNAGGRTC